MQNHIAHITGPEKYHKRRQPNLKTVHVEPVRRKLEPEHDVVDHRDGRRGRNSICDALVAFTLAKDDYAQYENISVVRFIST